MVSGWLGHGHLQNPMGRSDEHGSAGTHHRCEGSVSVFRKGRVHPDPQELAQGPSSSQPMHSP
eukprot:8298931-Heterocapsa_arctica.AAC.1